MFSDVRILQHVTFSDDVRVLAFGPHIVDQHLDDLLHGRHLLAVCDADHEEGECKNMPRHGKKTEIYIIQTTLAQLSEQLTIGLKTKS